MSRHLVSSIGSFRRASLAGVVAVLLALALGMAPSARASEPSSQISGTVTEAVTLVALPGVEVCAYARNGGEAHKCTSTASNGEYTLPGLTAGSYTVEFSAVNLGYVTQYYDDQTSYTNAQPVTVQAGDTTPEINAKLVPGGSIAGKVIDATTQAPIEDVLVCAFEGEAEPSGCAPTGSNGEYVIAGLPSGTGYKVEFDAFGPFSEYKQQFYDNKSSLAEAQSVSVTASKTTSGINAALQPIPPAPPVNKILPKVSGTPAVGATLTCSGALWTVSQGGGTITFQWLRDGAPVPGATTRTYTVQAEDQGHSLACEEIVRDAGGVSKAVSAALAIPAPVIPPPPPSLPVPALKFASSSTKLSVSHGSVSVPVPVACVEAACHGTGELTTQILVGSGHGKHARKHKQTVTLAKGSFSLAAGDSGTVVLRITKSGKTLLASVSKHHPLHAQLSLSVVEGNKLARTELLI